MPLWSSPKPDKADEIVKKSAQRIKKNKLNSKNKKEHCKIILS